MKVFVGSDHAGFELKAKVVAHLKTLGHEAVDCGPHAFDPEDDYPPFCFEAARRAVEEKTLGVVIGGSGNGEAIAANKVKGARCALAHSEETARLGRLHNDANVISLGARMLSEADALKFVEVFVSTAFSKEERHIRRIALLTAYEA